MRCALNVSEDALHERKMSVSWSMHEEAHLLDSVGDVRSGESQIPKGVGKAALEGWIREGRTIRSREFLFGVYRCGDGIALGHVSTLEDFIVILLLAEKQTVPLQPPG